MDEDLDYTFQEGSSVLGGSDNSNPDEGNKSVLTEVLKDLQEEKAAFHTVDKLSLDDKKFTIEQQLQNNKWAVQFIGNIELKIKEKIKELGNG